MSTDNKPDWCPQDLWDETSSAFDLLYKSEPDLEGGCEYGIRSMAAAVAMVAIATERERCAKVCEAAGSKAARAEDWQNGYERGLEAAAPELQLIETAPRDGTPILMGKWHNVEAICLALVPILVCLTLVAVVSSCSFAAVDTARVRAALNEACYDRGGTVSGWTGLCELPTPTRPAPQLTERVPE